MKEYLLEKEEVIKSLNSSMQGLTSIEAEKRNAQYGLNALKEAKKLPLIALFFLQFKDVMTLILLAAAILSGAFGHLIDMGIIFAVIILNAVIGLIQEGKAEKSIEALKKLSSQMAKVYRDGKVVSIDSKYLTPGDIVVLEAGDSIPVDLRLIEVHSFQTIESSLTGESTSVEKSDAVIKAKEVAIGDQKNMAFMGTTVSYGRAVGIVAAIGMDTEMGKIADILNNTKGETTPLQKQLDKVGEFLSITIICICIGIFLINIVRLGTDKEHLIDNLMLSISLAVAAIPEGLSSVITLVLSIGVTSMSKKNAIIRKLRSIETLGCAEIICSDKTGTLTENRMTVVKAYILGESEKDNQALLKCAVLCNDSMESSDEVKGDPTETALIYHAHKLNVYKKDYENKYPRINELPFDSTRKLMSTFNKVDDKIIMYTKGATDEIVARCKYVLVDDKVVPFDSVLKDKVLKQNADMAANALRVLGFAYKEVSQAKQYTFEEENDLTFLGFFGMIDPVRKEVKGSIVTAKGAGIRTVMITGDHLITAVAIGKELGIITDNSQAITGKELDKLTDYEFSEAVHKYSVYARVSPENKVRIVKAWKAKGKIVAMTGDGVNDAPALKSADIGVGMGITGTDVTKNVADIVLSDDNFSTIVMAVEEGRKIYANIKKTIQFLISSNACEVLTLLIATIIGFNILSPIMILWVNLVTDTIPAVALGLEGAELDIMEIPPRDSKKSLFSDGTGISIIYQSIFLTGLVLLGYFIGSQHDHATGETMAFFTLASSQIFHSFNLKSLRKSIFHKNSLFNNFTLNYGAIIVVLITIAVVYTPGVNSAFGVVPLSPINLLIGLGLSFAIIPLVEMVKFINSKVEII